MEDATPETPPVCIMLDCKEEAFTKFDLIDEESNEHFDTYNSDFPICVTHFRYAIMHIAGLLGEENDKV